jgi:tripartite ATP-independent transporter DctP family solute receptor
MMITAQAPVENTVKEWQVLSLPYLFDSIDDANHVLQGPVGKKFLDMLPAHNMIGLAWISVLERDLFTVRRPVRTLEDMKGLTIRVMQTPGYINGYRALGANPTPLAYNQVYLSLQQGVVDAGETGPDQFVQDKFIELSKHFYLTHVNYLPVAIVISKFTWNKLTPDLQRAVQESATEAANYDLTLYKKIYNETLMSLKGKGVEVGQPDLKLWMQAAKTTREEMLSKIPNGEALYKEIMAAKVQPAAKTGSK